MLLQEPGCENGGVKRLTGDQLHPPTLSTVRQSVYFGTEQSQRLSRSVVISRTGGPAHPSQYSLMPEIQLLGVGIVIDEKAALDGV